MEFEGNFYGWCSRNCFLCVHRNILDEKKWSKFQIFNFFWNWVDNFWPVSGTFLPSHIITLLFRCILFRLPLPMLQAVVNIERQLTQPKLANERRKMFTFWVEDFDGKHKLLLFRQYFCEAFGLLTWKMFDCRNVSSADIFFKKLHCPYHCAIESEKCKKIHV